MFISMFDFLENKFQKRKDFHLRILISVLLVLLCFIILGLRSWNLQIVQYKNLSEQADLNRAFLINIAPPRGNILDRNGEILACNCPAYVLEAIPEKIPKSLALLDKLSVGININAIELDQLKRKIIESNPHVRISLRNNLHESEASWFAEHAFEFPGIELKAYWMRNYPQGSIGAHVIGYIGRISSIDLKKLRDQGILNDYKGIDFIGKKGIEKICENKLRGKKGLEKIEINAARKPIRVLEKISPEPGSDVSLSIDIRLQRLSEKAFGMRKGALVAISPETGEILAFVSKPSFDPNLFVNGMNLENWNALNSSPDYPLLNRALHATYPIGSTYKPFVALAALELGKRSAIERIADPGYFEFGGRKFRNSRSVAYGMMDMHRAIVLSSDTYFYSLGPEIGVNALHDFLKQFGFGQITGIDLDGEKSGILPSTEWKRLAYRDKDKQRWYPGETISLTVGQGYNSFTLLQLAQGTAVLANGGSYRRPHLVQSIKYFSSEEQIIDSVIEYQIPLNLSNVNTIKSAMADVVRYGTARRAFFGAKYTAAGKTGTAQLCSLRDEQYQSLNENLKDHSLFIGFAPLDRPKIAVALIVENAGWGGNVAASIARKVFDYWLCE